MLGNSPNSKISKQPSSYLPVVFHLIRIGQFLSAAIVLSILSFFVHFLQIERFYVPWTFLLLLTVSVLTIFALIVTGVLHHLRALSPLNNLAINGFTTVLWALGFALLTWNIRTTLSNRCSHATWHSEGGIMICRLYKALTAFTITGLVSTALALLLDLRIRRIFSNRGAYNPMQDVKISRPRSSQLTSFVPLQESYNARSLSHEISRPYTVQTQIEVQHFGYTAPSEQTTYDGPSGSNWL